MELIPYDAFGRLRMQEFWPSSCEISSFDSYTCLVGYADGDVYGYAYFVRNPESPAEVVEIRLESFEPDTCPDGVAERLFARLNLPLKPGMSLDDVVARLGRPIDVNQTDVESTHSTFVCGHVWPYYVLCIVWRTRGLQHVMVVRKDLYDRALAREAEST